MTREIPDNDPVKGMGLLRDVVLVLTTRAASSPIHSKRLPDKWQSLAV